MRLRIVVHRFRPDVGGTELMAEMMASAMARRGMDTEVLTLRTSGAAGEERFPPIGDPEGSPTAEPSYRVRRLDYLDAPIRVPVGYWRALREPTDVVHLFGNRIWCTDFFLPIARWVRVPKVLTAQDFYQMHMHPGLLNDLYARRYFPKAAEQVDCYVVQTDREAAQIRRFGYRGRLEKIPHTVDPREFPEDAERGKEYRRALGLEGRLVLLSAGGYAPNKRMDRVIEGVAAARSRWTLLLSGNDWPGHDADLAHCRRAAERLEVDVRFLGAGRSLPRPEVIRAFYGCDAYAQGSSYEGYGGAIQEAMLVGRPFVAFDTGAVSEFAAAGAGSSVQTVPEFAECLDRMAASEELRRSMGGAGRRDVLAHRTTDVTMAAYARIFEELARPRA